MFRWCTRALSAAALALDEGVPQAVTPQHAPAAPIPTLPIREGLRVSAFFENSPSAVVTPIASGRITAKIAGSMFAVTLDHLYLSPIVEVGSRVHIAYGADDQEVRTVLGGIVVRVNGNGTVGALLDNNSLDLAVPPEMISLSEGRAKFVNDEEYLDVVEWVRSAGVMRRVDQESVGCVLFQRGWRVGTLYLLEAVDIHCMTHIPKSVRMSVLDKAEWQRDHHRQMRQLLRERVKERDFRYRLTKYSGVVSASMALLGITFAFGWNMKNYHRQQRKFQLQQAVRTLTQQPHLSPLPSNRVPLTELHFIRREEEESVRRILRQLDTAHPRIVVLTGPFGSGKSAVCRAAVAQERQAAVYVNIRTSEDVLRSVAKALGVQNVDVCGDLLDFVAEACHIAKKVNRNSPLLVLKLREGSNLRHVYNEAVALACDLRLCRVVIEVPIESLTIANTSLPHLDFFVVPNFTPQQAMAYTQHTIDPVALATFIEVVGTNSNDLDELFSAVHQCRAPPAVYTHQKLVKAIRQLQNTCNGREEHRAALRHLAAFAFDEGQHGGVDDASLRCPALRDIVLYDPVKDVWWFRTKLLHTAARCLFL